MEKEKSLTYHNKPVPGKISLKATKPCETQEDLSLAYTPGVAIPCLEIKEKKEAVYDYTAKGNLVAVVSDGTAVLGLGNIGPEAGLPVMEGKAVLFKHFAGIDAIGICLSHVFNDKGKSDPAKIIETTQRLEPSFGGINLEDIGAPACFEIETKLKELMNIPVFHDDQHGTAIICTAAILNSLQIIGKKIEDAKFVVNGAGAAGISCIAMCIAAGAAPENITMCDSRGVIYKGRKDGMTDLKEKFAVETDARTLTEAMVDADIFMGLSVANCVTKEMVQSMATNPIVLAMANPTPEIYPEDALAGGAKVVCTGRSDFPNQVNNVLGFPGIFRGALDVRATTINEEMKMAAAIGLQELAQQPVPEELKKQFAKTYPEDYKNGVFDGDNPLKTSYVIPKPFDPRVVPAVARKVAEAAMKTGVARTPIEDLDAYQKQVAEFVKQHQ
jgi:malate dehydrogenase (oxaloacetate-decarboxylating)(NADP+)